ncbi:MAG: glycosyltransferase family 4 protein [Planctomycetaceae bacterium]
MKALALVDAPDHVCCRYRLRAFEPALHTSGGSLSVQAIARGALGRWRQLGQAGDYDSVILQRKLLPTWQLQRLRRRARHLVFDFDDAVLYRDSYDLRGPSCRRRAARFAAIVRSADAVIAGNDFLADCALRFGASVGRVHVIPTCIDTRRYRPSEHVERSAEKASTPHPNPPPRGGRENEDPLPPRGGGLGWGGTAEGAGLDLVWIGSSSTLQGLELQRPLWERIGREVPGARLRVICDRFPSFEALPVVAVPWSGSTEADALAAGDVGISWIPDDLWSRGKCGLKVLQYQAAGLPVLANPVGVQAEMVVPEVSGLLATTPDEWVEAVRRLATAPALRLRMGRAARASVESRYSVAAWAETFVAAIAPPKPVRRPVGCMPRTSSVRR